MPDEPYSVYEYQVVLEGDSAPARVIRMVGKNKKILEIGAGPGAITRHLSGTNGCDVVALEVDPDSVKKLARYARKVIGGDLNDSSWPELLQAEAPFDVVIAADVLEHVYDPLMVLKGMKSLLNESGVVILSLPHVGHSAIVSCLMEEDFAYQDWGLLDKTHIRFFGIKNIQALYESAGMAIEYAEFVVRTPEVTEFADRWARMPADLRGALSRNPFGHVYQVVSRAAPAERVANPIRLLNMDATADAAKTQPAADRTLGLKLKEAARSQLSPETRVKLKNFANKIGVRF